MQIEDVKPPRVRMKSGKLKVPPAVRAAAAEYKQLYKEVYSVTPTLTYDGTYICIAGQQSGVGLRRLKELTTQLKNRGM